MNKINPDQWLILAIVIAALCLVIGLFYNSQHDDAECIKRGGMLIQGKCLAVKEI